MIAISPIKVIITGMVTVILLLGRSISSFLDTIFAFTMTKSSKTVSVVNTPPARFRFKSGLRAFGGGLL